MRELDDTELELRLRGVLKEQPGALPLDLTTVGPRGCGSGATADRRRRLGGDLPYIDDSYLGVSPRHAVLQMMSVSGSIWMLENIEV